MSIGPLLNGTKIKTTVIANLVLIAITMLFYLFALSSKFNNTRNKNIIIAFVISFFTIFYFVFVLLYVIVSEIIINMNKLGLIELRYTSHLINFYYDIGYSNEKKNKIWYRSFRKNIRF